MMILTHATRVRQLGKGDGLVGEYGCSVKVVADGSCRWFVLLSVIANPLVSSGVAISRSEDRFRHKRHPFLLSRLQSPHASDSEWR